MTHKFVIELTDDYKGYEQDVDYIQRIYGAEPIKEHDEEIYNIAIDDFLTDIINKINFEDKWLFDCKSNNANTDIAFSALRTFVNERAEQLKADGENDNKAI